MKKVKLIVAGIFYGGIFFLSGGTLTSCTKCMECHYEKDGADIELSGEYCDDEIEVMEANGYTDSSGTYPAHCGAH